MIDCCKLCFSRNKLLQQFNEIINQGLVGLLDIFHTTHSLNSIDNFKLFLHSTTDKSEFLCKFIIVFDTFACSVAIINMFQKR